MLFFPRNGVVLSGTHWTPEQLENWLYTQCWAMGYAHFDAIKKQQLKERILHAITHLKVWNEAVGVCDDQSQNHRKRERDNQREDRDRIACVIPPSIAWGGRTLSAHDAMGGGDVVGGGDSALSSGWTPATGQWPSRDQALRSPPPPPSWSVVDWANGKLSPPGAGSGSDREKKSERGVPRSRSASKSRAPSRAASGHEIFIPDSSDEGHRWSQTDNFEESYGGQRPQPGVGQQPVRGQQRIYLNPSHAPSTKHSSSRQLSPDPYNIYGPPAKGKGSGIRSLNAFEYGSPSLGQRLQSHIGPASFQNYHEERKAALRQAQAEKLRKKKEKDRKRTKAIGMARSSKWEPRYSLEGDVSAGSSSELDDTEEETDEDTDGDDIHDNRRARGRSSKTNPSENRSGYKHVPDSNGWHTHNSFNALHSATPGAVSLHPPADFQPSGSRPSSRNASPGRMKKRPPPLALSPPPVIPSGVHHNLIPANLGQSSHPMGADVAVGRGGAAGRAQFQFEQQQKDYQRQLVKQSLQPTVKEVARRVAEQIAAQQAAHFRASSQVQPPPSHHGQNGQGQRPRGTASWSQPHQPAFVGNQHQSWYQPPQQYHRSNQRLRPTMTEIYH